MDLSYREISKLQAKSPQFSVSAEFVYSLDFIVLIRDEKELEACKQLEDVRFRVLQSDKMDISSTMVRDRVKAGEDISNLVPEKVKEYIEKHHLYRD